MNPHIHITLYITLSKWNYAVEDQDDPDNVVEGHAADYDQACAAAHQAHDEMRARLIG